MKGSLLIKTCCWTHTDNMMYSQYLHLIKHTHYVNWVWNLTSNSLMPWTLKLSTTSSYFTVVYYNQIIEEHGSSLWWFNDYFMWIYVNSILQIIAYQHGLLLCENPLCNTLLVTVENVCLIMHLEKLVRMLVTWCCTQGKSLFIYTLSWRDRVYIIIVVMTCR